MGLSKHLETLTRINRIKPWPRSGPYDTVYIPRNEDRRTAETRFRNRWNGVLTVTDAAEVDYRYILEETRTKSAGQYSDETLHSKRLHVLADET